MTVTVILVSPGPIRFAYIFSGMLCVVWLLLLFLVVVYILVFVFTFFSRLDVCILYSVYCLYLALSLGGCQTGGLLFWLSDTEKKCVCFFSRAHATFNPTEWKKAHTKTNNKSAQKSEPFLLSLRLFSEEIWQKCIRGSGASCLSAWHSAHANLMRICFIFICCRLFCRFFFSDSLSLCRPFGWLFCFRYIFAVSVFSSKFMISAFFAVFFYYYSCVIYINVFFCVLLLLCVLSL